MLIKQGAANVALREMRMDTELSTAITRPASDHRSDLSDADRKLLALRARIVASGRPLLDWGEVEQELAERRGGVGDATAR